MKTRVASRNRPIRKRRSLAQPVVPPLPKVCELYPRSLPSEDGDLEKWKEAESELLEPEVTGSSLGLARPPK